MTPMIDVVFLLLIFFLSTTSFEQARKDLDTAIAANVTEGGAGEHLEPARVRVLREGQTTVIRFGAVTTSDRERLAQLLGGFSQKSLGAFVEVGPGVPYGDAAAVLSVCQQAGFTPVTWLAAPERTGQ